MFKKKKYKIEFKKTYHWVSMGAWCEVTDAGIMRVLGKLQTQYGFEIISAKLQNASRKSEVTIQCDRANKSKIFMSFISELAGQIEQVKI